ncbi:MAG: hypothetical protein Tsb0021_04740 [Chlamydiales bacterium]
MININPNEKNIVSDPLNEIVLACKKINNYEYLQSFSGLEEALKVLKNVEESANFKTKSKDIKHRISIYTEKGKESLFETQKALRKYNIDWKTTIDHTTKKMCGLGNEILHLQYLKTKKSENKHHKLDQSIDQKVQKLTKKRKQIWNKINEFKTRHQQIQQRILSISDALFAVKSVNHRLYEISTKKSEIESEIQRYKQYHFKKSESQKKDALNHSIKELKNQLEKLNELESKLANPTTLTALIHFEIEEAKVRRQEKTINLLENEINKNVQSGEEVQYLQTELNILKAKYSESKRSLSDNPNYNTKEHIDSEFKNVKKIIAKIKLDTEKYTHEAHSNPNFIKKLVKKIFT